MNSKEEFDYISYRQKNTSKPNPYAPFIYAVVLVFGVALGYVVNTITMGKQNMFSNANYDKVQEILDYVDVKYVDTVNREQLLDGAIDKLLSGLDPHSVYIPASELKEMNESLEGNFEGVGIEFYLVQDTITVVTAIPGGPSESVGIKAGDRIVKINDTLVAGVHIEETGVKKKLRGPAGTKVHVSIMRSGAQKLVEFDITRGKIPLYSVDASYMIDATTGYIRINNFSATTHAEFVEKVNEMEMKGMKKLIIDLRGNPGGYLQAATSIADEVIGGKRLLVYTQGKSYDRQNYNASKTGLFETGELCVLIDQGSASASEILSGAIQDWDRGTIVGRTSFGKGLVQEQFELRDGSALRLTVARYYTPSGRCIQRSYEKGTEEYYNEIYERYARGEFVHEDSIISSDTTVYKTAGGRRVYGGGGIRPDVFVPMDTSADNEYYFAVRSFVPEFVYKYSADHPEFLNKYKSLQEYSSGFAVSDALYNEFISYATAKGLKDKKERDGHIAPKIKTTLRAFFAKQVWRMEGYYFIANQDDSVVKAALEKMK